MNKKVFMLSTSRCGYCRQAKSMINADYPGVEDDGKFRYFQYDVDEIADAESAVVLKSAQDLGVRGVPFTVLLDNGIVTKAVRGYDPHGIKILLDEALS